MWYPKVSILGPLLYLIYVNDFNRASDVLDPIIFGDDTSLINSHKEIKTLFHTANTKLVIVNIGLKLINYY